LQHEAMQYHIYIIRPQQGNLVRRYFQVKNQSAYNYNKIQQTIVKRCKNYYILLVIFTFIEYSWSVHGQQSVTYDVE
jgi:hypothetical protein